MLAILRVLIGKIYHKMLVNKCSNILQTASSDDFETESIRFETGPMVVPNPRPAHSRLSE